jgi:hypothetical protein
MSEILDRIASVYMEMVAVDRDKYDKVRGICKNSHVIARLWAVSWASAKAIQHT